MKLIRIFAVLVLTVSMMVCPVFADEAVPSPGKEAPVKFAYTVDENGNHVIGKIYNENDEFERNITVEELIITTLWHLENGDIEVHDLIEEALVNAKNELFADDWHKLIPEFEEQWDELTGGAPTENAVITDIFDVRYNSVIDGFLTRLLVEGKSATFDIVVEGIDADTLFVVGHKPSDTNEWVLEDYTISEDGVITISVDSLSPFFIAADNGEAPAGDDVPSSPQTGVYEADMAVAVIAAAVIACAAGFLCAKKFRKAADR